MFTKTEYWNTNTALNIQFHIYKWNCTISHHKCTVYPSKTIFLPIYFYLAVNLQGFFTSSSTAKQKVSNLLLSWFTFFVEIAHFSDWAVFIWAALSAIGTTQHTPEKKGWKQGDTLCNIINIILCIASFVILGFQIYHLLSYLSCSTLSILSNPLPFMFPGVSSNFGPKHPCP